MAAQKWQYDADEPDAASAPPVPPARRHHYLFLVRAKSIDCPGAFSVIPTPPNQLRERWLSPNRCQGDLYNFLVFHELYFFGTQIKQFL